MKEYLEDLAELSRDYLFYTDRTAEEERAFREYITGVSASILRVLLIVLLALFLASWPVEYAFFESYEVFLWFSLWRAVVVPVLLAVLVGLYVSPVVRNGINEITLVGSILCLAWIGYCLGQAAQATTHRSPWFFLTYVLPFLTTPMALRFSRRTLGTALVATSFLAGYFYSRPDFLGQQYLFSCLIIVAGSSVLSLGLGHIIYHLNRKNFFNEQKLEHLASHDQLTGLTNRRAFERKLESTLEEVRRYGEPLSLIMVDLDHFKQINDTHGHASGDDVLERFGELLRAEVRQSDVAGRYGGEEFAVLLPHTPLQEAKNLAGRVREKLKAETFRNNGDSFTVTCSVGVTQYAADNEDRDTFVQRADEALYVAKEDGRDRVVVRKPD